MNENPDKLKVLFEQLNHLNQRSRWYTAQLWQVPFAYLGISGLAVGSALKDSVSNLVLAALALACSAFGVAVFIHILGLQGAENRAVGHLIRIEEAIKKLAGPNDDDIIPTAKQGDSDWFSLKVAVLVAAIFFFFVGLYGGVAALDTWLCHCRRH